MYADTVYTNVHEFPYFYGNDAHVHVHANSAVVPSRAPARKTVAG